VARGIGKLLLHGEVSGLEVQVRKNWFGNPEMRPVGVKKIGSR